MRSAAILWAVHLRDVVLFTTTLLAIVNPMLGRGIGGLLPGLAHYRGTEQNDP